MIVTAYKGFHNDLTCRGFQYELGKDYTIDKTPKLCQVGFHACVFPLDVLEYYIDGVYAKVQFDYSKVDGLGELSVPGKNDSKICGSSIHICESLVDTSVLFMESIEYILRIYGPENPVNVYNYELIHAAGGVRTLFNEMQNGSPLSLWHMVQFENIYSTIYDFWNRYTKNKTKEEMIDIYKTIGAIKEE